MANVVTSLAQFNYESYVLQLWHTTTIMIAFIVIFVISNLYFKRLVNILENFGSILHFTLFIAAIIVLAVTAHWGSSKFVFNTLTHDQSGWTNPAVCWGLGLMPVVFPIVGESG